MLPITLAAPTLLAAQSGSVYVASEADNRGSAQLEQIPTQSGTPRVFDGIGDPSGATIDGKRARRDWGSPRRTCIRG